MYSLRKKIKESESGFWFFVKRAYLFKRSFAVPAPRFLFLPVRYFILSIRYIFISVKSVFWVTPLYKSYFEKVGKGFSAGNFLPFVVGKGKIYVGDNVKIHGKVDFIFGTVCDNIPEIHIGNDVHISHNLTLDVTSKLVIGDNTIIASGVTIQDCSGHSVDPAARANGEPPKLKDVKTVTIGKNVWVCSSVYILPGVNVGDHCVLGAGVIVKRNIPNNSVVYLPAPVVKQIS